jgi:putative oxidoreductase
MRRIIGGHTDTIYGLFRIVAGLLFMFHGLQKMFGAFGGQIPPTGSLGWFAGVIELVCGFLIMIGLFTSWAAFLASGTMAFAYFKVHQPEGTWPIENQGELAALYAFVFLYIAARGAGPLSVANALRKPALE